MPCLDKPLAELETYTGTNPRPADFDAYWDRALQELDAVDPAPRLEPARGQRFRNAEAFDLWFTGLGGARLYAKYVRPRHPAGRCPAVLEFHGYNIWSGEWTDKLKYPLEGVAVAALDCRGQSGKSEDVGGVRGPTQTGHIIRGLDDHPDKLLYRSIFLDTVQLARVVASFDEIDARRLSVTGGSQGGALAIACAALEPRIGRCVALYPFLSDYQRVWDMDLAKDAYAEIKHFFRVYDTDASRRTEIFTRLGYIDVHHLAPRVKAEVVMALTLQDSICPPSTQFAVYNNLMSPKRKHVYPDFGHEGIPGFFDQAFNFLTWHD